MSKRVVFEQFNEIEKITDIVSYSYKTNPEVGDVLQDSELDCFFSLNSKNSVKCIRNKEKIIYFLQGETVEEIVDFLSLGISVYVVDNENDLKNVIEASKRVKKKITLFLRVKLKEHTIFTGKYFVYGFSRDKVMGLIDELRESPFVDKLGIHVHRKTQNIGEWNLVRDFSDISDCFDKVDYVDIGGGLPWVYSNSKPDLDVIKRKILDFREFVNAKGVKLLMEPGRFISAPAVRLIARAVNVYDNTIVLDCSVFNAYMDTFLLNIKLPVLNEVSKGYMYLIKGRSPDSLDIFRYVVYFDKKVKIGDEIVFINAGAYNFYSEFNGYDKLETKVVEEF